MICTGQCPALSVAAASWAESAAEGLGLGGRSLVLNLDLGSGTLVVDGVVLAGAHITADTGDFALVNFLIVHVFTSDIIAAGQ